MEYVRGGPDAAARQCKQPLIGANRDVEVQCWRASVLSQVGTRRTATPQARVSSSSSVFEQFGLRAVRSSSSSVFEQFDTLARTSAASPVNEKPSGTGPRGYPIPSADASRRGATGGSPQGEQVTQPLIAFPMNPVHPFRVHLPHRKTRLIVRTRSLFDIPHQGTRLSTISNVFLNAAPLALIPCTSFGHRSISIRLTTPHRPTTVGTESATSRTP